MKTRLFTLALLLIGTLAQGAQQTITLGTAPSGTGGDSNRTAFGKVNANFTELYTSVADLTEDLTLLQPLDNDLTAIAAVATTAYGRSFLSLADAAAARTLIGLGSVENTAISTWAGSTNLTTLGTVGTGTWNASIIAPAYLGSGSGITSKFLRGDGTWQTLATGTGDALVSNPLSQFAATTSAQLAGVLTNESGTGTFVLSSITDALQPLDADLTQIAGLADPNADRLLFWDDSAGVYTHLTLGTNLSITGTTINATGSGGIASTDIDTSAELRALVTDESGTGALIFAGGALGTPSSVTLTNGTGLPVSTGLTGLGTGGATFLATPSSANLAAFLTGESGTGNPVFSSVTDALDTRLTAAEVTWTIADPGADAILAWDDSDTGTEMQTWTLGTGISNVGDVLTLDSDLVTWAGVTPGTGVATFLASPTATNFDAAVAIPDVWMIAFSDETTAITTGTAKVTFRAPYAVTVTGVKASLTTVSSSGIPTIDINEAGTTILSTKLTIDASEKTSTTAATAAVISDTAIALDAEITIDVDVAGTGATGGKVYIFTTR